MIRVRVKRSIFQWSNQSFWPGFSKACSKYDALRLIKHTTETTPTLCLDLEASCAVIARLIHLVMHAGKHSVCVCVCRCCTSEPVTNVPELNYLVALCSNAFISDPELFAIAVTPLKFHYRIFRNALHFIPKFNCTNTLNMIVLWVICKKGKAARLKLQY